MISIKKTTIQGLLLLGVLSLAGCAIMQEDFQKMSPEERANLTCKNSSLMNGYVNDMNRLKRSISETQTKLDRGYAIFKECREVLVPGQLKEECFTDPKGHVRCVTTPTTITKRVCRDVPVAIDGQLEKEKLAKYKKEHKAIKKAFDDIYAPCFERVIRMSPDRAFYYYDHRELPPDRK